MNKKFLSAILFGALMVTSTGTFVSCKDYDDDIDEINSTLNDLKSQIAALQTAVDNGKWITNVATTSNGIAITMNDGTTYNVTNGEDGAPGAAGEAGAPGDKVVIDETTGAITINGEETGFFAAKDGETGKVVVPEIDKDGFWCVVNEKGELEQTSYKASPVSAVQNPDTKIWTLKVWNTATKAYDEIALPTAAAMLTELDLAGWANFADVTKDFSLSDVKNGDDEGTLEVEYAYVTKIQEKKSSTTGAFANDKELASWSAQKEVKKGQVLTTLAPNNTKLVARIAPAELDPSSLKFTLQDSKGNVLPISLGAPEKFTGTLTRAAGSSYAFIPMDVTAAIYNSASDYTNLFAQSNGNDRVYSLVEASNYRSTYGDFAITAKEATVSEQSVTALNPDNGTQRTSVTSDGTTINYTYYMVDLNKPTKLVFGTDPELVYDYYVEPVDATVAELFGYSADKKNGTFTLSKSADQITKAPLELYVYALHIDGNVYRSIIYVKPTSRLVEETVLKAGNVTIAASDDDHDGKMAFKVSLADMFTKLGTDNTKVWQSPTLGANAKSVISVKIGSDNAAFGTGDVEFVWVKADGKTASNIYEATDAIVYVPYINKTGTTATRALSVDKEYTMAVNFMHGTEVLNSVKITFTPVLPAVSSFLTKKTALWNDDASVLMAYFNDPASTVSEDGYPLDSSYDMEQGFTEFGNDDAEIALSLDSEQKLANDKKVYVNADDYQAIIGADKKTITLNTTTSGRVDDDANKEVRAYGKELNVKVGVTYLEVYTYTENDTYKAQLAAAGFKVNVQSALVAGYIKALASSSIEMEPAAAGEVWKVTAEHVGGYTYSNQPYSLFKIATAADTYKYKYTYIQSVEFATPDKALYTVVDENGDASKTGKAIDPVWKDNKEAVASYVALKPGNTTQEVKTTLNVTVKDAFGYTKYVEVPLTINKAK